ncbi:YqaJ viral recombinase family protein [Suicoccus acidiformans]|uniref:YqaJ viral recombinase family nuclease n=1 Tax=Suicoccus acidiformans TaxID=2036206 RepID=UPI0013C32B2A|nr:YqaJ viral recombinase family protein [Suicoccus acidiformans]
MAELIRGYDIAENHDEWLKLRSKGLGGSDIGSVLGLNPYKSPYQVWLEKTGQLEPEDLSDKVAIQIGNELEDLVARMFTQQTGKSVRKDNKTHYHKEYPFLLANIDRKVTAEHALLECKTTSAFNADQWKGDNIPASYLMQVQHYLNVLDYDRAYIAVIIGNHDFVYKEIEKDPELIDLYQEQAVKFWTENVMQMIEPEVDGSYSTKQALESVAYEPGKAEPLQPAQREIAEYILSMKQDIKLQQDLQKQSENILKDYMAKNELTELTSESMAITWKTVKRKTIDSKRLKTERPDIYEEYSKESSSKRFEIKER